VADTLSRNTPQIEPAEAGLPAPRAPASQPIYSRLQAMIMAVELEPGQRLTVEALARQLKISPTPIREALARLESDGLVAKTHLRGYRVADQQARDQFEQMFEIRLLLEPRMAGGAARRADAQQRAQLLELQTEIRRTTETSRGTGKYHEFAVLDARFHQLIAVAAGNDLVAETLDRLHVHLHLFRLRRDQGVADHAVTEHEYIVSFICEGDPQLAEAAMLSHLQRSLARVRGAFGQQF
jgi:DNA-binding GntR family transcriptional regulator